MALDVQRRRFSGNRQAARHGFRSEGGECCIGPQRADLVLAGCAIFEAIREVFPAERTRIADRGLREGCCSN